MSTLANQALRRLRVTLVLEHLDTAWCCAMRTGASPASSQVLRDEADRRLAGLAQV